MRNVAMRMLMHMQTDILLHTRPHLHDVQFRTGFQAFVLSNKPERAEVRVKTAFVFFPSPVRRHVNYDALISLAAGLWNRLVILRSIRGARQGQRMRTTIGREGRVSLFCLFSLFVFPGSNGHHVALLYPWFW